MTNLNPAELNQSLRDAFSAWSDRSLAVGKQMTDWQLAQVKAVQANSNAALNASFSAMEQGISLAFELSRISLGAFAPVKTETASA